MNAAHGNKQVQATPALEGQLDESQLASHTHTPILACQSQYTQLRPQAQQGGSLRGTQRDDTPALCVVYTLLAVRLKQPLNLAYV